MRLSSKLLTIAIAVCGLMTVGCANVRDRITEKPYFIGAAPKAPVQQVSAKTPYPPADLGSLNQLQGSSCFS